MGLSHNRLLEVLEYDPLTGVFRWKIAVARSIKVGQIAGTLDKGSGYWRVKVDGEFYQLHILAWFYTHGVWPKALIDHKDGKSNAISNLREADYFQNAGNKRPPKTKAFGLKGVSKSRHQFAARICINGNNRCLGYFKTSEEAGAAYDTAALAQFGEFALTNKMMGLL